MGIRYHVNEDFFRTWNDEMAYALGFIYADGSLEDSTSIRGKYLRITNTEIDRLELIRTLLQSEHIIVKDVRDERDGDYKICYLLRIGNAGLYESLCEFGLTPNKSLTMKLPAVPREYFGSFLLGYFDGDGCVHLDKSPEGSVKRLLIIFTSGSKDFLNSIHNHLTQAIGIKGRGLYKHGSALDIYQLRYSTRDSLRVYLYMYHSSEMVDLCLRRKYAIFMEYLWERNLNNQNIPLVLEQNGPMVKR